MKKIKNRYVLFGSLLMSGTLFAAEGDKKFEVYGFTQLDYIQDFKRVQPEWDDTLRPSKIPTEAGKYGSDGQSIMSVKQSRFGVNASLPVQDQFVKSKLEIDLYGVGEDEGQTTLRLRHAYGEYGKWLAGQTHSLFMDIDTFPNTIDYWGPNGMVFLRNPQIRYSFATGDNVLAVAIEKPSNDIDSGQLRQVEEQTGFDVQGDEKYPDLTVQGRINRDWGHFQASGILRSIGYETVGTATNEPKGRKTGWGVNLTSNINILDKDKIHLGAVYGHGIASYMNDGGTDMGPEGTLGNPRASLIPLMGLMAFYDHYWSERYSSSIGWSSTRVDNSDLQDDSAFQKAEYASVNLLHTPVRNVMIGGELLWGSRQDKDGAYGDDIRTQISFKYSFSSLDF